MEGLLPFVLVDNLPRTVIQILLDGLSKSAVFIMIAAGLTLVFGLMGVLNFAHGSLTMIGAYLAGALIVTFVSPSTGGIVGLAIFFVVVAVTLAVLTAAGAALEVSLIRPIYDRPPLYQILLTFGLTLVFDELLTIVLELWDVNLSGWGAPSEVQPNFLTKSGQSQLDWLFGVRVNWMDVFEIGFGALVIAGIWAFLTRTRYGLYIRAGSEDAEMAEALGIDVSRAFTVVFGLGVGLAGVAGALLVWDSAWTMTPELGAEVLLPAFVVVIVGGLGTFRGTVVAGLIVGMADAIMTWVFNEGIVKFTGLPELVVFLVLVFVLIVRPQGLFGVEEVGGH
jgi:branched-chain amino acid transport system permease protein